METEIFIYLGIIVTAIYALSALFIVSLAKKTNNTKQNTEKTQIDENTESEEATIKHISPEPIHICLHCKKSYKKPIFSFEEAIIDGKLTVTTIEKCPKCKTEIKRQIKTPKLSDQITIMGEVH